MSIFFYYLVERARPSVLTLMSDNYPIFTYVFNRTYVMEALILLYAVTIVYGRLYSGMHSVLGKHFRFGLTHKIVLLARALEQSQLTSLFGLIRRLATLWPSGISTVRIS